MRHKRVKGGGKAFKINSWKSQNKRQNSFLAKFIVFCFYVLFLALGKLWRKTTTRRRIGRKLWKISASATFAKTIIHLHFHMKRSHGFLECFRSPLIQHLPSLYSPAIISVFDNGICLAAKMTRWFNGIPRRYTRHRKKVDRVVN